MSVWMLNGHGMVCVYIPITAPSTLSIHLQVDSDRSVEEVYADVSKLFRELTGRN